MRKKYKIMSKKGCILERYSPNTPTTWISNSGEQFSTIEIGKKIYKYNRGKDLYIEV
jgi:hypothetical protein